MNSARIGYIERQVEAIGSKLDCRVDRGPLPPYVAAPDTEPKPEPKPNPNMNHETLSTLSSTPPPAAGFGKYNVSRANKRIAELKSKLGINAGPTIWKISQANALIAALEKQVAESTKPALSAAPAPLASSLKTLASVPAVAEIAPATLAALAGHIFGTTAASDFEGQRRQFGNAGLAVPGLVAWTNPHFTPKWIGLARTIRADRQMKIDAFFKK